MRRQIQKSGGRLPRDKRCTVTKKEQDIFYYRRIFGQVFRRQSLFTENGLDFWFNIKTLQHMLCPVLVDAEDTLKYKSLQTHLTILLWGGDQAVNPGSDRRRNHTAGGYICYDENLSGQWDGKSGAVYSGLSWPVGYRLCRLWIYPLSGWRKRLEGISGGRRPKPFSGGQLLEGKTLPFGRALTRYQCIQYALDKPGVLTVLPGIRNVKDVKNLLGFFDVLPEERDYSVVGTFTPGEAVGNCVYCNHCQPCPAGLNVGLINKYYDLAVAGDSMAAGIMGIWKRKLLTAWPAATATGDILSM